MVGVPLASWSHHSVVSYAWLDLPLTSLSGSQLFVPLSGNIIQRQNYDYLTLLLNRLCAMAGNKRDAQELEEAVMRFLRQLLDLTQLDRQRNREMSNRLKVNDLSADIKLYRKKCLCHMGRMDRSLFTIAAVQYQPGGQLNAGKPRKRRRDQEQLGL